MQIFIFAIISLSASLLAVAIDPALVHLDEGDVYQSKWIQAAYKIASDPGLKADLDRRINEGRERRDFEFGPPEFVCEVQQSKKVPTSVHELRPSDVNAVAALGDSITAGFGVGAENILEVFNQNKGESWSVGGDKDLDQGVITLANVLRKFNPELKGMSTCKSPDSRRSWLNVAVGGATNRGMPGQARDLVDTCLDDERIDIENDWKVVTLFIGGNDLCSGCENDEFNTTMFGKRIEEALDILHADLPRTLVNLVPMFDITPVKNFSEGIVCEFLQPAFCRCGVLDEFIDTARPRQLDYFDVLLNLTETGKYDTKDDFTVVLQPMLRDLVPPLDPDTGFYDKTFLSFDCFHPSLKAHQAFAYALWNTMLIPVDEKPLEWDPYEEDPTYYCPTPERPYFATSKNTPTP